MSINKEHKALFWQTRVKITQAPEKYESRDNFENLPQSQSKDPDIRTFLYDPIGVKPTHTFGIELSANEKMEINFFTKSKTEKEGLEFGSAWLSELRYKFRGLDGRVGVNPIHMSDILKQKNQELLEIVLPIGILTNKINVFERFIKAFYYIKNHEVKFYILWQEESRILESQERSNSYKLRCFLTYNKEVLDSLQHSELRGILKFLSWDIETNKGKKASLVEVSDISLRDIMECNVFNTEKTSSIKHVVQEEVNFDFPQDLPLPKMPILEKENVRYIDINESFKRDSIQVGNHIKNGVISHHVTYVPIKKLPQDLAIFGKSGCGKTYFLARLVKELAEKAKNVGVLVLNVAKSSQEIFYRDFTRIKYSDDNFHIPYFIESDPELLNKILQETATYICASLGLKNVFEKIIYRTQIGFMELKGELSLRFIDLLKGVERYIINNPYGPEEQANLLQVFRNRMNTFDEDKIQDVLKISKELPTWVLQWLSGENIFLDVSMCNKFIKLLVVNAIFQLIRNLTKDSEVEALKYLVVIDEAHAIIEKPITTNSDDADFIMKEQMAKIFSELLKEYRSRGVGIILADQSPSSLFDDVVAQPSIKVVFRQDYPNNLLFTEDHDLRELLTQLPKRIAIVFNGATGEKFLIKTLDHNL